MTDIAEGTFPRDDEPEHIRRRKARALATAPLNIVSGAVLRLAGARILHELGDISLEELKRYEREARRGC